MIIKNFIPKSNEDLIDKTKNDFFKGKFILKDDIIYWQYEEITILRIILFNQENESYIEYFVNGWGHDHIPVDEIYGFLIEINGMDFSVKSTKKIFGKQKHYIELERSNSFDNIMEFSPYNFIGKLKFGDNEKQVDKLLGKIKEQNENFGGSKTVIYNDYDNCHIYFDNSGKLYGIHLFNSLTFKFNNAFYVINFNSLKKDDLKDISDDFIITANEEGEDYTSKKLGIDFYFNDYNQLEAVLFMSNEYYDNEIKS